ncbi:MAG: aminopeptidase P family protein [Ruminococcaceae bacterium]|nr:aminopeptidase P family protein [Oscillospiraceae bacterium]
MNRLSRLQEALCATDTDCAIISSELNQRYLSGLSFSDGYILVTQNDGYLITDSRYIEIAKRTVTHLNVILADRPMTEILSDIIKEKNIKRVGVEEKELSLADYERFKAAFDGCTVVSGISEIMKELRAVKTPDEIALIEKAQIITDAAFSHILEFINPEVTEKDVALELEFFMRRNGAEGLAFETIAVSGASSSLPHGKPSDEKLRKGFLTMDFGAKYEGYCSDMTRTVCIGKADEEMKLVYNTVLSAQIHALESIKVGMPCRDADALARDIIREAGYGANFGHSLGHGVGMFIHEFPRLAPSADENSRLKAGHVVTVEPGIYLEGRFGCRIEDMIAIKDDGSVHNFTKSRKELIEI